MVDTLAFDPRINDVEEYKGWVGRYDFLPDNMTGLNNEFFSFKNGDIYVHHSNEVPRTNYYGVQYGHSVSTIFSKFPDDDKLFKTINTDSTIPYDSIISSEMSIGHITSDSFIEKESVWFAYIRGDQTSTTLTPDDQKNMSTKGVGIALSWSVDTITFSHNIETTDITIGANIYHLTPAIQYLGVIASFTNNTITVTAPVGIVVPGEFILMGLNKIAEAPGIRGIYGEVTLSSDVTTEAFLYSVSTEVLKSFP